MPGPSDRRPQIDLPDVALDYASEANRATIRERVAAVHEMHDNNPTLSPKQKRHDLLEAMGVFKRMGLEHPRERN